MKMLFAHKEKQTLQIKANSENKKGGTKMLNKVFNRIHARQKGITGLETAIILIAFVVVAAVFAYTVLSAGLFATQKSSDAVYSGLKEAQSTMELKGAVIAFEDPVETSEVGWFKFTLAPALKGEPINFTAPTDNSGMAAAASSNVVTISYIDQYQRKDDLYWTATELGDGDGDALLEVGERFEICVTSSSAGSMFSDVLDTDITANRKCSLEIKPPAGATLVIERTMPAVIDDVINLN